MAHTAKAISYTTVSAKVIRADGRVEDLGIISDTRKKTMLEKIKEFFTIKK